MEPHRVYFYGEDDSSLIDPIGEFLAEGLEREETVIVIASDHRRFDLKRRLLANNVISLKSPNDDHFVTLDASTTVSLVMRAGWPDERPFFSLVGQVMGPTQKDVRIYQEMTALLLAERDYLAALHLERLWTKLVHNRGHSLLCGYPASAFQGADKEYFLTEICACHSQSIGRDKCSEKAA